MENIELTFTQCKQIADNENDWREVVERMDDQPVWILDGHPVTVSDIHAIQQGGCASGAYMPAVTYHQALETMSEHGDDVLDFIQDELGEIPKPNDDESWSGIAVFYLSTAVELWCGQFDLDGVDWD